MGLYSFPCSMRKAKWILPLIAVIITVASLPFILKLISPPEIPGSVYELFRNAEKIEYLTVDPMPLVLRKQIDQGEFDESDIKAINGYAIVDSRMITDRKQIESLIEGIYSADRENNSTAASCFNPRHAIRLADQPDQYLLICFECLQLKYTVGSETKTALISSKPASRFNFLAEKLGMKLKPDSKIAPDI